MVRSISAIIVLALASSLIGCLEPTHGPSRLDRIRARGHLTCGVALNVSGFGSLDATGRVVGFEPDLCRAVAAAIFRDPERAKFVAAASLTDFKADPEMDLVARRLTVTLPREADGSLQFSPIVFYDGVAFLVPAKGPWRRPLSLAGRRICLTQGSEADDALTVFSARRHIAFSRVAAANVHQAAAAFFAGRCDALTADLSQIGGERAGHSGGVGEDTILPDLISKEPLALLMHSDDREFSQVVRWTVFALIEAEELDIRSSNIDEKRSSPDPDVAALTRSVPGEGRALGLNDSWAGDVIRGVGNYGELYERNLGMSSPLKLKRGPNAAWTSGGLLYAPPMH